MWPVGWVELLRNPSSLAGAMGFARAQPILRAPARSLAALRHRHHAAPPLGEIGAGVDVVLAQKGELAVLSDPEYREGGRNDAHLVALPHRNRNQASRHQDAAAGVKRERAGV